MSRNWDHRWSGWPGAWCLDCGIEDDTEYAICCPNCRLPCPDDPPDTKYYRCAEHPGNPPCKYPGQGLFDPYKDHSEK